MVEKKKVKRAYPTWLEPYRAENIKKMRKNTVSISGKTGILRINYYAYEYLGRPDAVDIKIDYPNKRITLTPDSLGVVLKISTKSKKVDGTYSLSRVAFHPDIYHMPKGSYESMGHGVYQLKEG